MAVTATYLLRSDESTLEDYRRCSYRNRFRMLDQAATGRLAGLLGGGGRPERTGLGPSMGLVSLIGRTLPQRKSLEERASLPTRDCGFPASPPRGVRLLVRARIRSHEKYNGA